MEITYDLAKNDKNIRERGLSFDDVAFMEPDTVRLYPDMRRNYGEPRYQAFGLIKGRLYVAVITPRGDAMRVISFRKANSREERKYEKENTCPGND